MGLRPIRACLAGFLLLLPHPQAWAWGNEGHRIIADIAWDHLTPATRENLQQFLEEGDLASIATCLPSKDEAMALRSLELWGQALSTFHQVRHSDEAESSPR